MEERRYHVRINESLSVSYQVLKDFLRPSSHSVDISEGGIRLSVYQRLEQGCALKIWVHTSNSVTPIMALGEVVWSRQKSDARYPFELGIKFIKVDPTELKKLSGYIKKLSPEEKPAKIELLKNIK